MTLRPASAATSLPSCWRRPADSEDACPGRRAHPGRPQSTYHGRRTASVTVHASIGIAYSKVGDRGPGRDSSRPPTWPCTRPRPGARTVTRSTNPPCRRPSANASSGPPTCKGRSTRASSILHYQPIVSLDGSGSVGLEALIRWHHPNQGLCPQRFHPVWPRRRASSSPSGAGYCKKPAARRGSWQHDHHLDGTTPGQRQYLRPPFPAREPARTTWPRPCAMSELEPHCLVLEITESLLVHDAEAVIARMMDLKTRVRLCQSTTSGPAIRRSAT